MYTYIYAHNNNSWNRGNDLKKKVSNIWEGLEEEKEREMLSLHYNLKNKIKVFVFNLYILLIYNFMRHLA